MSEKVTLAEWAASKAKSSRNLAGSSGISDADRTGLLKDAEYFEAVIRLDALVSTPELEDFAKAIQIEAVHQRARWGEKHDASKSPHDWAAVLVHLLGKAINAAWAGDSEKFKHHIITIAATCNNWHARVTETRTPRHHPQCRALIGLNGDRDCNCGATA